MNRLLRIVFCALAVLCAAITTFILLYFGPWGLLTVGGAIVFGGLMYFFKKREDAEELKKNPPPPVGDFITGAVPAAKDEAAITAHESE